MIRSDLMSNEHEIRVVQPSPLHFVSVLNVRSVLEDLTDYINDMI